MCAIISNIAASLVAVDWSAAMIAHVWPGDTDARRAVLGDWLAMPLRGRQFSAVIGDGSLNALEYASYGALFAHLAPLLLPGARLAVRVYETPARCEGLEIVRAEAMSGRIVGFHAFKWRLAMATQRSTAEGVCLADVWSAWRELCPDPAALGWANQGSRPSDQRPRANGRQEETHVQAVRPFAVYAPLCR